MFAAYVVATLDFVRHKQVLIDMARVGVPESWLPMLIALKATGALGLLIGVTGRAGCILPRPSSTDCPPIPHA